MGGAGGLNLTLAENVQNFLRTYNTPGGTNYISDGLTKRLENDNIIIGKPEFGQISTRFPCVFVKITEYNDEIDTLGSGGKRKVTYGLEIYPVTSLINASDLSAPLKESYKITDNILSLIRANHDLSMPGHWVEGINVSMDEEVEDATNIYMNKITLLSRELAA